MLIVSFRVGSSKPTVHGAGGERRGCQPRSRLKFFDGNCSPIRRTLPRGCAHSPAHSHFLFLDEVAFFQAVVSGDGGARRALHWRAEGRRTRGKSRIRKITAISRCAQASAREVICGAGIRTEETAR